MSDNKHEENSEVLKAAESILKDKPEAKRPFEVEVSYNTAHAINLILTLGKGMQIMSYYMRDPSNSGFDKERGLQHEEDLLAIVYKKFSESVDMEYPQDWDDFKVHLSLNSEEVDAVGKFIVHSIGQSRSLNIEKMDIASQQGLAMFYGLLRGEDAGLTNKLELDAVESYLKLTDSFKKAGGVDNPELRDIFEAMRQG